MNQTFAERVKELGLPLDQIIIIGSGILDQLGIHLYRQTYPQYHEDRMICKHS